ncbi:MAG: hypothetical protein QMD46_13775, partial [Methanomicrobiales archaeon]|nr:hypothetical protein [Methanomicrobiales archaeon]
MNYPSKKELFAQGMKSSQASNFLIFASYSTKDIEKDLEYSAGDYAHAGFKAGLSLAPVLGGSLAEFFSMVIAPPIEKRREAWLVEIHSRLKLLENKVEGFKIENLAQNEQFISILLYATQAAMRTHQQEKLDAFRNMVVNSALRPTIDENLQLVFLNLVDRYTPWHLVILKFADNPRQYGESLGINYPNWGMGSLGGHPKTLQIIRAQARYMSP